MAEAFKEQVSFAIAYSSRGWYITQLESEPRMTIIAVMATKIPSGAAECGDLGQGVGNRRFRIGEFVEGHQAGNHQRQQGVEHQNQPTGTNQRSWHGFSGVFNFAGHITDRGHAGIRPTGGRDPRQQRHKAARCANRSGGKGGKILRFKPEDPKANDDSERDNFGDGN